jgi:Tol biopolymer transport system component
MARHRLIATLAVLAAACRSTTQEPAPTTPPTPSRAPAGPAATPPIPVARAADGLILPGEEHFAHLWRITDGVENAAEGYWSPDGRGLVYQATPRDATCDRMYVIGGPAVEPLAVSSGRGVTTCGYFLPDGRHLVYSSTQAFQADCPPRPDMSQGYVWSVHPEYDVYRRDLATGVERAFTSTWGYDAEATVSPRGDRIVFTSSRTGDLELWTCDLEGGQLAQVTRSPGYDGGAFFSHDGTWLVFRSSAFTPGKEAAEIADYQKLLGEWKVRPTRMEIMLCRPDGSERRAVTKLGKASFAPYFFPDDQRIVFASNFEDEAQRGRNFDLYAVDLDGSHLEKITRCDLFDGFPVFSPDGHWLVFASNRGGSHPHETNLYLAEWR